MGLSKTQRIKRQVNLVDVYIIIWVQELQEIPAPIIFTTLFCKVHYQKMVSFAEWCQLFYQNKTSFLREVPKDRFFYELHKEYTAFLHMIRGPPF